MPSVQLLFVLTARQSNHSPVKGGWVSIFQSHHTIFFHILWEFYCISTSNWGTDKSVTVYKRHATCFTVVRRPITYSGAFILLLDTFKCWPMLTGYEFTALSQNHVFALWTLLRMLVLYQTWYLCQLVCAIYTQKTSCNMMAKAKWRK